jgi:uncharacterized cupredoxin-like copper-binding protein
MRIRSVGAVLAAAALMVVPWGDGEMAAALSTEPTDAAPSDPDPTQPPAIPGQQRRIDVEMKKMSFSPDKLDVKLGETVTFVFKNTSNLVHDAFIGDKAAQDGHEKEMRSMKDGQHDHAGHEGAVTVHPGETAAVRHRFEELGTFEIGCHQLYHYAAGMKVIINVTVI